MKAGTSKKRPPPPQQPLAANPPKHHAISQEEEFLDEDVFLDETLVSEDQDSLILRDLEERQALATRLSKWVRPPLSDSFVSQSRSVGE